MNDGRDAELTRLGFGPPATVTGVVVLLGRDHTPRRAVRCRIRARARLSPDPLKHWEQAWLFTAAPSPRLRTASVTDPAQEIIFVTRPTPPGKPPETLEVVGPAQDAVIRVTRDEIHGHWSEAMARRIGRPIDRGRWALGIVAAVMALFVGLFGNGLGRATLGPHLFAWAPPMLLDVGVVMAALGGIVAVTTLTDGIRCLLRRASGSLRRCWSQVRQIAAALRRPRSLLAELRPARMFPGLRSRLVTARRLRVSRSTVSTIARDVATRAAMLLHRVATPPTDRVKRLLDDQTFRLDWVVELEPGVRLRNDEIVGLSLGLPLAISGLVAVALAFEKHGFDPPTWLGPLRAELESLGFTGAIGEGGIVHTIDYLSVKLPVLLAGGRTAVIPAENEANAKAALGACSPQPHWHKHRFTILEDPAGRRMVLIGHLSHVVRLAELHGGRALMLEIGHAWLRAMRYYGSIRVVVTAAALAVIVSTCTSVPPPPRIVDLRPTSGEFQSISNEPNAYIVAAGRVVRIRASSTPDWPLKLYVSAYRAGTGDALVLRKPGQLRPTAQLELDARGAAEFEIEMPSPAQNITIRVEPFDRRQRGADQRPATIQLIPPSVRQAVAHPGS